MYCYTIGVGNRDALGDGAPPIFSVTVMSPTSEQLPTSLGSFMNM